MQTHKKILVLCILIVSSACHPGTSLGQRSPCDATNRERLATAYALAWFYPERFVEFVQQEEAVFSSSAFRRCIDAVALAFYTAGVSQPSRKEVEEKSMDIASQAGRPDLGPTVADNIIKSQANYTLIAMTLEQLSQVLAGELAYKDTIMYENVEQRQDLKQLWILSGAEAELPGYWDALTEMLFEGTRWQMELACTLSGNR